ncbi:MAG: nucleoside monophosphate kinase [Candidatus Babeliaceae bacterium]|nr:nucleoside monophosphate kinase [Candidatus Babeliaceae bacterium]
MKSVKDIYILIGPPGSGKGSLSHLLKKNLGWAHLSTGNLCRQHITRMTDIGLKIDHAIKSGKLIEDKLMITMVASWIQEATIASSGIILDGFPRTVAQARALDYIFNQDSFKNSSITIVSMNINDDHVINRLRTRYVCQNDACQAVYSIISHQHHTNLECQECGSPVIQRIDDKGDIVFERLKIYHRFADDLLDYYRNSSHKVIDLNVEMPLENVFKMFIQSAGKCA